MPFPHTPPSWDSRLTIAENRLADRYGLLLSFCDSILKDKTLNASDRSRYELCRRMLLVMVEVNLFEDGEKWWREIGKVERVLRMGFGGLGEMVVSGWLVRMGLERLEACGGVGWYGRRLGM